MRRVEGSHSKKARLARWALLPVAGLALIAWVSRGPSAPPADVVAPTESDSPSAPGQPDFVPSSGTPGPRPSARALPIKTADALARDNAAKNAAGAADRKAFAADGWTLVNAPAPEPRLTALDPALLRGREADLRTQIASTTASPENVPNLVEIIRAPGAELQTRTLAIESLGRINGEAAQTALLGLLDTLPIDDPARKDVAPLLRPRSVDDAQAAALARRLDSGSVTPVEREQLAFTLALLGLRDGRELPQGVRDGLSSGSQRLLAQMTTLARTGGTEGPQH